MTTRIVGNYDRFRISLLVLMFLGAASANAIDLAPVYVTTPANNALNQNVALNITAKAVPGASIYTIEISDDFGFAGAIVQSGARTQYFDSLLYNTVYYARVKTDLEDNYGQVTTFTTRTSESLARVTAPANTAGNVNATLNITAALVLYAGQYTIQLSETEDFGVIAFEVSGSTRTLAFTGLKYSTTYYNRVFTDLSVKSGSVGSFITRAAESVAYVVAPAHNSAGIATSRAITASIVPGATTYTIQLSETDDFGIVAFAATGASRVQTFSGLKYNTMYYNRVRTNLTTEFGQVRSFTTRSAELLQYVVSPSNGAIDRGTSLTVISSNVPGATSYTIQLSEDFDFLNVDFETTGPSRASAFTGLNYSTLYHSRVSTDQESTFGPVSTFTTRSVESLQYITGPANGAINKPLNPTLTANLIPGAASYTIDVSSAPDFSKTIEFTYTGAANKAVASGLDYSKTYYARVITDLGNTHGPTTTFTTLGPEAKSYVTYPQKNQVNVSVDPIVKVANVPGAAVYWVELSTTSNFNVVEFEVSSGTRFLNFTGLTPGTTYYSRVHTDLSGTTGAVRSFKTAGGGGGRVRAPVAIAENEAPVLQEFDVRLYPNPFKDKLVMYIESTDLGAEVALTDMSGRAVHRSQERTNVSIEIGTPIATGVYLLQVRTAHHSKALRVVKVD